MSIIQPPKGTRDFYPEDQALQDYIFTSWQNTCNRYGFEKYEAPMFEHLELYTHKSGQEIEKQLYTLEDKAGRKLALRPEMTPSLARMIAQKGQSLKLPVRWYSIPRLFRYEKMQKGRLREFYQINMDIFGIETASADAELIAAAIDLMRDLGFTASEFSVHVSSRTLLEELSISSGVPQDGIIDLFGILDKKNKLSAEEFEQQLYVRFNDKELVQKVNIILAVKTLDDVRAINPNLTSLKDLEELFVLLGYYDMSDYVQFDISVVRGLAYYTGIVFELFDKARSLRAIAGGGRYDTLVSLYGGPKTPATGFAMGDVVLAELLSEYKKLPELPKRSDVFIISLDKTSPQTALSVAQLLRRNSIRCEFPLKLGNIGKQMKLADASGATLVLFSGGDEQKNNLITCKNMKTGKEILLPIDSLPQEIMKLL